MAPSRGGAGAALLALLAAVLVCLLQTTTTVQAATTLQTTGDTFEAAFEVSWTPRREGPRGRHWPPRSRRPPASVTPTPLASLTHELSRVSLPLRAGFSLAKPRRRTGGTSSGRTGCRGGRTRATSQGRRPSRAAGATRALATISRFCPYSGPPRGRPRWRFR